MIKASCSLLPKRVREIENILFEMSPTNWVIITNRNTKASTLEGTFDDETSACERIEFLNKAFGETIKFSIEKEFKSEWKEAYKHHFQAWNYKMFHFVPTWEKQTTQITSCIKTKNGLWFIHLSVQIVSIQLESPFKQKLKSLELTDLRSTPYQFPKLLLIWVANSFRIFVATKSRSFTGAERTLKLYLET